MENQVKSVEQAQSPEDQAIAELGNVLNETLDKWTTEGGAPAGFEARMGLRRSRKHVQMAMDQFWATYHRIDPAIRYTNGLTTAVMSSYSNTVNEWYDGKASNRDACFRIDLDVATLVRHFVYPDPARKVIGHAGYPAPSPEQKALAAAHRLTLPAIQPVQLADYVTVEVA